MNTKSQAILLIVSALALVGLGCRNQGGDTGSQLGGQPLVVWGLWQESAWLDPVTSAFEDQTGVKVEYRKIASVATYERMLLEALAEGRGPDVFVIHHTWVEGKRGIMSPAPTDIISQRQLIDEFVPVVNDDVVRDGLVYALPTSVDTLALYYNQDLLASAGIAQPPSTWTQFQRDVEKITQVSRLGIIEQSAAALGTAANVNRAPDVLQLLMLQSGISLLDDQGRSDIAADTIGERALTFYTDFSNKSKQVYTWDLSQDYSIDAFAEGETAMMLNYSYHIPTIKAKNSRLRFNVAGTPQIADSGTSSKSFANYWPFAVSNSSRSPQTAWQFVRFMTSAPMSTAINQQQMSPPARRDTVAAVQADPQLGVYADQALTAVSWPRVDIIATDAIFNSMIDDVATGTANIQDAIRKAKDQIEQLSDNTI